MVTCSRCQKSKANSKFGPNAANLNGKSSWCKDCKKEYQRAYVKARRNDPEFRKRHNESAAKSRLGWYGITEDDYQEMLTLQGGKCAGCGRLPNPNRRLDVDHKHQPEDKKREPWERASMVRGLLCHLCNRVLGILRDDPNTFRALANYLENPPAVQVVLPKFQRITEYLEAHENRFSSAKGN